MLTSGVYAIHNLSTTRTYIGSTRNLSNRFKTHRWALENNKSGNHRLQMDWNEHGGESFVFIVLLRCPQDQLLSLEQEAFSIYQATSIEFGYNVAPLAGSNVGIVQSAETKERRAKKLRGRKVVITPEWRAKLSAANKGKRHSEERKEQISRSLMWRMKLSVDQVREIREKLASGWSQAKISREYKCAHGVVAKIVRNQGIYRHV